MPRSAAIWAPRILSCRSGRGDFLSKTAGNTGPVPLAGKR
jgi:hypothetical protein